MERKSDGEKIITKTGRFSQRIERKSMEKAKEAIKKQFDKKRQNL